MSITLNILKAFDGDCIIIKINENDKILNIIVDSGKEDTYIKSGLKDEILKILESENECIDLLIITYIDDDHIEGFKAFFEDDSINQDMLKTKLKEVWFNSANVIANYCKIPIKVRLADRQVFLKSKSRMISKNKANTLETKLLKLGIELKIIKALDKIKICDSIITILSPNDQAIESLHRTWPIDTGSKQIGGVTKDYNKSIRELRSNDKLLSINMDSSIPNRASIAFILEHKKQCILLLGDSHASVIIKSLSDLKYSEKNKLKVDIVKLSHHGSDRNTSPELLSILDCDRFIISTDGRLHGLPRKKCLARVINSTNKKIKFYFNYELQKMIFGSSLEDESREHDFEYIYIDKQLEV